MLATFVDGNVFTIVDNTAKQRNVGGEFEANFSTDTFSLAAFYSYTKVKIRAGRVVLANGLTEFEQRGVPKHQLGATATISPPVSEDLGQLNFIMNYTWRSKIYLDDFEVSATPTAMNTAPVSMPGRSGSFSTTRPSRMAIGTSVTPIISMAEAVMRLRSP